MKIKLLFFAVFISLVISCQTEKPQTEKEEVEEIPDGGPCTYKDHFYPAVMLSIDSSSVGDCDFQVMIHGTFNDTLYYHEARNYPLPLDSLHQKNIKVGDTITFLESTIVTGSCSPRMTLLLLEKYSAEKYQ